MKSSLLAGVALLLACGETKPAEAPTVPSSSSSSSSSSAAAAPAPQRPDPNEVAQFGEFCATAEWVEQEYGRHPPVARTQVFTIWQEAVLEKVSGRVRTVHQAAGGLSMGAKERYALYVEGAREIGVVDWKCPLLERFFHDVKIEQDDYEKRR